MNYPELLPRLARGLCRRVASALAAAVSVLAPAVASAQISYTGSPYVQNFDSLASSGSAAPFVDNTTIPGWYVENHDTGYATGDVTGALLFAGSRQAQSDNYTPGTGSSNTGALYSFGVAGVNGVEDRALGAIGSGTPDDFFIGMAVKNDTGLPLSSFTVTYDGEQWRLAGNATQRAETVYAFYRIGGTAFDGTGTWTPLTALDFTSPNVSASASGSALDGNASGNRVEGRTATVSAPVQPGDIVWILWMDIDHGGSDHGMALDNVQFTATTATAGAPVISSSTSATGAANSAFVYQIVASGSPSSYGASDLPAWLSVNTSTGELTGTPTAPGVFPVTVSATNGTGTGSAVVTITISPDPRAPVIASGQTITHLINTALSYQVQASNSPTSFAIGTIPNGLFFDTAAGVISGTPTTTATFNNIPVSATNEFGTGTGTINIALVSAPVYTGDLVISAYAGASDFSVTLGFTQSPFAYLFENLPPGLVNNSGAVLSGTVPSAGEYSFTVTATNDQGSTAVTVALKVIDSTAQAAITQNVVVNKFSNSEPDRVELLVIGNGTPGSTVDMRGMILKDFSGDIANDGGGRHVFSNDSLWSAVPAGTLVVLSAGVSQPQDESVSDHVLAINLGNTTYFAGSGSFDIATREMVMIKAAGMGTGGVAGGIHALASGGTTAAQYVAFLGPKIGATATTAFGFGVYVNNATSTLADFTGTGATGNVALASLSFGAANNPTNLAYIASLRPGSLSPVQAWRQTHFGVTTNSGDAADAADPDGDGIPNLIEYATGTHPMAANASVVDLAKSGDFLTLAFPVVEDASLTYTVQASNDLAAGFVPATGTVGTSGGIRTYTDDVSLATPGVRRFLRLQVGRAE